MCEWLSKAQQEICNGGMGCCPFREKEPTYADKGGHRERSIANQPQHLDQWKNERMEIVLLFEGNSTRNGVKR